MADVEFDNDSNGPQRESKTLVRGILILAGFVAVLIVGALYWSEGKFLLQLQETAVSRGLITFLVATITVVIALIVAVWVIVSYAKPEDLKVRFSYAKDVLSTLVGILGTILGFYFGSADKQPSEQLVLADLQFHSGQLIAHVSGGTPPYRYTLLPGDVGNKGSQITRDGWIFEYLPKSLASGSQVVLEVVDSKDRKTTRVAGFLPEGRDISSEVLPGQQRQSQGSADR